MKTTAGIESNDAPILGCPTCNTTAGKAGCPIHGMTSQEETMEWEKDFDDTFAKPYKLGIQAPFVKHYIKHVILPNVLSLQHTKDCRVFEKIIKQVKKIQWGKASESPTPTWVNEKDLFIALEKMKERV